MRNNKDDTAFVIIIFYTCAVIIDVTVRYGEFFLKNEKISFLFGGIVGSFIVSFMFYKLGVAPKIDELKGFNIKAKTSIAKAFSDICSGDPKAADDKLQKENIEKGLLGRLFPETIKCIEQFHIIISDIITNNNCEESFSSFIENTEIRFLREATESDKEKAYQVKKDFFDRFNDSLKLDILKE